MTQYLQVEKNITHSSIPAHVLFVRILRSTRVTPWAHAVDHSLLNRGGRGFCLGPFDVDVEAPVVNPPAYEDHAEVRPLSVFPPQLPRSLFRPVSIFVVG